MLTSITSFINLLLDGRCHPAVIPFLFGGNLIALEKKSGGIRPIAVGYYWRRLAAKCANNYAISILANNLSPIQVGVGVKGGCEASIHASRRFLASMTHDQALAKLDFSNAFNSIRRDCMLEVISEKLPSLYRFCHCAYAHISKLKFGDFTIDSEEGAQQGDPLGPLLFCLTLQPVLESLECELVFSFLDDVNIGGDLKLLANDIQTLITQSKDLGLELNVDNVN